MRNKHINSYKRDKLEKFHQKVLDLKGQSVKPETAIYSQNPISRARPSDHDIDSLCEEILLSLSVTSRPPRRHSYLFFLGFRRFRTSIVEPEARGTPGRQRHLQRGCRSSSGPRHQASGSRCWPGCAPRPPRRPAGAAHHPGDLASRSETRSRLQRRRRLAIPRRPLPRGPVLRAGSLISPQCSPQLAAASCPCSARTDRCSLSNVR